MSDYIFMKLNKRISLQIENCVIARNKMQGWRIYQQIHICSTLSILSLSDECKTSQLFVTDIQVKWMWKFLQPNGMFVFLKILLFNFM